MQNIIGSSHEHMAFQILLHIPDDRDFLSALRTSKQMISIASHQRIWKERTEFYYPEYLKLQLQTGLNWKDFYPFVSLISRIERLQRTNEQILQLRKLVNWLVNCDIDYDLIFQEIRHFGVDKTMFVDFLCSKYEASNVKSEKTFVHIVNLIKSDIHYSYKIFSFFKYHNPKILFEMHNGERDKIIATFLSILNYQNKPYNSMENKFANDCIELYYSTFSEPYCNNEVYILVFMMCNFRLNGHHKYMKFLTPDLLTQQMITKIQDTHVWNFISFMITHGIRPIFKKLLLTETALAVRSILHESKVNNNWNADDSKSVFTTFFLDVIREFSDRGVHLTQDEVDSIHPLVAANSPIYMQMLRDCM